jgi:hypothetical protein
MQMSAIRNGLARSTPTDFSVESVREMTIGAHDSTDFRGYGGKT